MSFWFYNFGHFPIIAGMLISHDDFVQFFLGKDFQDALCHCHHDFQNVLYRMLDQYHGDQILTPHNKNKEFMISTVPAIVVKAGLTHLPTNWALLELGDCLSVDRSLGVGDNSTSHELILKKRRGSRCKIVLASFLVYGLSY